MERITIIGMGPVGASIGLALRQARLSNTEIVGTDADREALSRASKAGAVEKAIGNLRSAVEGAQLVIMDTSLTDTKELLEVLGTDLADGCVVTDTGPLKMRVMEWAENSLSKGVSFVGGHPLLKKPVKDMKDGDATLFQGAHYCVIPSRSADQASVKTVVSLVETLGAKPFFLDASEHDSFSVAMSLLPTVLSAAYVTSTSRSGSWREMSRLASTEFELASHLATTDPQDSELACLANPDALVHWIDQLITELYAYRNYIKDKSDKLLESFIQAWEARGKWEVGVTDEDASRPNIPSLGQSMATMLVGERLVERHRQMTSEKKQSKWKYQRKG